MLKKLMFVIAAVLFSTEIFAQKIDYKDGVLQVDGNAVAKIVRIKDKENFGITSTYELYAMNGTKLIIAAIASNYVPDRFDNGSYYYKLSFLTTNQDGIFSLSKFGPEKSFAKLIGSSSIIAGDSLSSQKVAEFIALKSKNPPVQQVRTELYNTVERDRTVLIRLNTDKTIVQGITTIGSFKDASQGYDEDTYQFSIPSGLVIATVRFKGGTNAKEFLISTLKDNNITQDVTIPMGRDKTIASSVDRNESTLLRVAKWLVDKHYL